MADFCRQCALQLFPPNEAYTEDLSGLSTPEDTAKGLYPVVICEGCGPTQVDHRGNCVAWDCLEKHGPKPPFWELVLIHLKRQADRKHLPRRLLLVAMVAATAALCSPKARADSEGWEDTPSHKPLPAFYMVVSRETIQSACGKRHNFIWHACTIRDEGSDQCTILVEEKDPPKWIKVHEEKHCAGYDHPHYRITYHVWFSR